MDDLEYCWSMLPKVSRSFAVCIPELPEITKDNVMISYLVCRIVDTIEDSSLRNIKQKIKQLDYFNDILSRKITNPEKEFLEEIAGFTNNLYEADLMRNTSRVLNILFSNEFPEDIKESVLYWTREMIQGMKEFLEKEIVSIKDQDKYCYYAAGTVGHMLTEIYRFNGHINLEKFSKIEKLSDNFALGLQKVNIIKNLREDFKNERRYWPSDLMKNQGILYEDLFNDNGKALIILNQLVENAQQHLDKALEYILIIPEKQEKLRIFNEIPLFLATATLSECYNNQRLFFEDVKISKSKLEEVLKKSRRYCRSNQDIKNYYASLISR